MNPLAVEIGHDLASHTVPDPDFHQAGPGHAVVAKGWDRPVVEVLIHTFAPRAGKKLILTFQCREPGTGPDSLPSTPALTRSGRGGTSLSRSSGGVFNTLPGLQILIVRPFDAKVIRIFTYLAKKCIMLTRTGFPRPQPRSPVDSYV
jgi:hypothetical protein